MEQCPVCMRFFTGSKYLVSHLHQSSCRIALLPTNHDNVHTSSSTLPGVSNSSNRPAEVVPPPNDDVVHRPMSMNAFGDIIVGLDDENSDGFPVFSDTEDTCEEVVVPSDEPLPATNGPAVDSTVTAPNPISTIHENESFNVPVGSDDKLIPMLRMIKAVREAGAPLVLLDTLVKIIKHEWQLGRLDIAHLCTHKTAMRRISKLFPSLPTPVSVTVTHERTVHEMRQGMERPNLTFPRFSFLGQLQDLLDDHVFSDLQNLVVDPNNRWEYYQPNSCPHSTDEIQDGRWFQGITQKVEQHCPADSIKDFVIGIQGYIDKTGTDALQRNSLEPLVFTLTLFTNAVRNQDKYWRVIALLPASLCQSQRKKHSFGASVRNYHIALRQALNEFSELQKNPPIVRLRLGNQFQNVRAHLYWVNTIADGLANEILTGRIQNRSSSPRLSRGCHCPQHLADNSTLACNYLRQSSIERLTVAALGPSTENCELWNYYLGSLPSKREKKAAESSLKLRKKIAQAILNNVFGQHVVDLVWFHVDQGPNPRGCFGSTPVDPMHAVEEGIIPNIMAVIIDPLPDSAKASLDALAIQIIACNRWDSDYPRMNFSGGFSSLTQLTADEKVGKMMLLWIIMQTPLGREILDLRCSPTFDEQRLSRAARFTSTKLDTDEDDCDSTESNNSPEEAIGNIGRQHFTGTPAQLQRICDCLRDHALQFVIPWIEEMIPCHQEILRRIVFQIDCSRGKGQKHVLPQETFLDRHVVQVDTPDLYCKEDVNPTSGTTAQATTREAQFSIDCTTNQLQDILEMILSFHASYKYGIPCEKRNFDANVRRMMSMIKGRIHRGRDSQNWSISKFHELLHMFVDTMNFGSHANIDAGKGEHGLKKWAKLPSKTVRTRSANHYYHDMATRIYENRLIELATSTLVPRSALTMNLGNVGESQVQSNDEEVSIVLLNLLMRLDVIGPSLLQAQLTAFLRSKADLVFPMEIYQEAKYSRNGKNEETIRATPNYRNSGPWHDCVLVSYEEDGGRRKEYPFQVHAFFYERGKQMKLAVGKMGLNRKRNSRLLDEWTYEQQYRIVDLETTSRAVFSLTIPMSCYRENSGNTAHRMYVIRDRISEWPAIFNDGDWEEKTEGSKKKRKRKVGG